MRQLIVYIFGILLNNSCAQHSNQDEKTYMRKDTQSTVTQTGYFEYKIEDKVVPYEEFRNFVNSLSLKVIDGTSHCKLIVGGGHSWYEAKDKNGIIYIRGSGTTNEKDFEYIYKK